MRSMKRKSSSIWTMSIIQMRSWLHTPRILIMSVLIAAQCFAQICAFRNTLNRNGYSACWIESIFYQFYSGCNMPIMSVFFLAMIKDVPYRMAHQEFFLIRCSRKKWMAAQIVYCVLIVLAMIAFLLVLTSSMSLLISTEGCGWGDDWRTAISGWTRGMGLIEDDIRNQFTPAGALLAAIIPMFCFWLLMVLIIMAFGIWGMPEVGIFLYASILVLDVTILFEMIPFIIPFPMDYATLEGIYSSCRAEEGLYLRGVLYGYAGFMMLLILLLISSAENCELDYRLR